MVDWVKVGLIYRPKVGQNISDVATLKSTDPMFWNLFAWKKRGT